MNPRYKVSIKWTPFPPELTQQISTVFTQNFLHYAEGQGEFSAHGRIYKKEITLRISFHRKGDLKFMNFEASIDYDAKVENQIFDKIGLGVDALAGLIAEYFENNEEIEIPYVWTEIKFEGKKLWVQHSTENPNLEAEANKILGLTEDDTILKNPDDEKSADALDATEEEFDRLAEEISKEPEMLKKKKKDDLH